MMMAIIQARMSSARLPGKVLADLCGKPVLQWCIERVQTVLPVVVAIGQDDGQGEIQRLCTDLGVDWDCPNVPVSDVLSRYYHTMQKRGIYHVVRITSDCPLVFPEVIRKVCDTYNGPVCYDYVGCGIDGTDCEAVFRFPLEVAYWRAADRSDREHVTAYIKRTPDMFHCRDITPVGHTQKHLFSVDTMEDLELCREIVRGNLHHELGDLIGWLQKR